MSDKIKSDYEYSRETYYELLEKGKDSLETMMQVARESEHPRAFEVFGQLFKQYTEAQSDLVDLHQKVTKIKGTDIHKQTNIQNNVMVGSTADLLKAIKSGALKDEPESVHIESTDQG